MKILPALLFVLMAGHAMAQTRTNVPPPPPPPEPPKNITRPLYTTPRTNAPVELPPYLGTFDTNVLLQNPVHIVFHRAMAINRYDELIQKFPGDQRFVKGKEITLAVYDSLEAQATNQPGIDLVLYHAAKRYWSTNTVKGRRDRYRTNPPAINR